MSLFIVFKMTVYINDGAHVKPGDIAFIVEGTVRSLLQTERIMLNIMQRGKCQRKQVVDKFISCFHMSRLLL